MCFFVCAPGRRFAQKDAAGVGDCYDGAFLAGLCQGKSAAEAARMGALNAAVFGPMEGVIAPETVQNMIDEVQQ